MNAPDNTSVDDGPTSSKSIDDHANSPPVVERPDQGVYVPFDNGTRAQQIWVPDMGALCKPAALDVPVGAGAQRLANAGAASAPGGSTRPVSLAVCDDDDDAHVIDDFLDDEYPASTMSRASRATFALPPREVEEVMEIARRLLQEDRELRMKLRHTTPNPETQQKYRTRVRRIREALVCRAEVSNSTALDLLGPWARSEATYKVNRAALKWHLLCRTQACIDMIHRARLDGGATSEPVEHVLRLQRVVSVLEGLNKLRRSDCLSVTASTSKRPKSKKDLLPDLPANWRSRFAKANARSPTYAHVGVILDACGVRPKELRGKGVEVRWDTIGTLIVKIYGAKVRPGVSGQPWRTFKLVAEALPGWFIRAVPKAGCLRVTAEPDPLREHLHRVSREIFEPDRDGAVPLLSAYVFRHSVVTELRRSGWTSVEIAGVIGELTAKTVKAYGLRVRGGRKARPNVAISRGTVVTAIQVRPADRGGLVALQSRARSSRATKLKPT